MSGKAVTLVDYGIGNLFSVRRAFETQGATVKVTQNPEEVYNAEALVFPGVGAFKQGIDALNARGLFGAVREYCTRGRPFFGLCVGMQIMFTEGHEFETSQGLGLIKGTVDRIPSKDTDNRDLKVPHIGWNQLKANRSWQGTCLNDTPENSFVYFVHSFAAYPDNPDDVLAYTEYGGNKITAVVARDHLMGCQFHPERSGAVGLRLISTFLEMCKGTLK